MKNKIFIFLVFLTNIIKGQSVDPETFPILNTGIGTKYLYTNTGGEGKILVDDIVIASIDTVAVTYSEFYNLITNNQLIGGNTYILIDFQTIYDQPDFDASGNLKTTLSTKTGPTEEIWVLALSSNQIADKAYSATYPKDEIQYDWTYNTTLVNGSPAKGRITERIDEWNNRTDYDHRVIKFIRYDDGNGNFVQINDSGRASVEYLTFGDNYTTSGLVLNNYLGDFYSIGQFLGQEYSNNVFILSEAVSNLVGGVVYNNTFSGNIFKNIFSGEFRKNTINGSVFENSFNGNINGNLFTSSIANSSFNGTISSSNIGSIYLSYFHGIVDDCFFKYNIAQCFFAGTLSNCDFIYNTGLDNVSFFGDIGSKTIDEITYPFLFNTQFKKELFLASDNNIYVRYFNGTSDLNILIP